MTTCPNPTNSLLNNLNPNSFEFGLQRIPNLVFRVQKVVIPGLSIEPPKQATRFFDLPLKGQGIIWERMSIDFILDEDLSNYKLLYWWMTTFCGGKGNSCVKPLLNLYDTEHTFDFSDAFINIYDVDKRTLKHRIKFIDCVPVSIGQISLDTTVTDVQPVICNAEFAFSYWTFGDISEPMSF